ncbi:hypothetical protein PF005_g2791 [Phytophthora fragariae]|uniref:Uncharacterized protein n=1 Tax=Phytophthora fragariae TaxID=53985 RepID=A0A6A3US28_9STRA|nr:hypothetical protein PF003_g11861 [Phytophthora fragariae]KAE8947296.1 hypothetical protein PF009_g3116 [Phytophthora fragariae]KAE9027556.1 hypothetical protein PF011_g2005 [Phytophthora fragariae]KAE9134314.1 hypothetical protein PF010_g2507 [Phytophthora fragariae]KAE9134982.1 hypothetical protein PF007_g2746 [Phytophthora fragariae]
MQLLAAIEKEVIRQNEEQTSNSFSSVKSFREFITIARPAADVCVNLKFCCLDAERLKGRHGTRVTGVGASQRVVLEPTANALNNLTPLKRKPYVVQVTV